MTFEEVIREYIVPQCRNDIDVSCKVFVVRSEYDRPLVEASAKERGLAEGEYTIIVSPELIEKIQNGGIKTTHQGTTSCRYPDPKVLKKRQEAKECVMEYATEYSRTHTPSIESVLLYVEQVLRMAQLDQMPKNLNIEKLKDECDKAKEKKQLPATRNTKPFYTKFLNKRHKKKK